MAEADIGAPDATNEPAADPPVGPRSRRSRGLPWPLLVISAVFSLAVGLLVATWLVGPSHESGTVSPDRLVSGSGRAALSVTGTAEVGRAAPKATFTYLDGSTGSLSDFAGSTVLLNFWGSTCAPCLREMPALERVNRAVGGTVTILGVNVSDSVESGRRMVATTGVSYPQVRDPEAKLMTAFGGTQLPHTVVIDPKGTVTAVEDGAQTEADFRRLVGAK